MAAEGKARMRHYKEHLIIGTLESEENAEFIPMITSEEEENCTVDIQPEVPLPILPLRNVTLFPGVIMPIAIGRKKSLRMVRDAFKNNGYVGALAQKDQSVDEPELKDLYAMGTIARIVRILEMPDGSTTILLQGKQRFALRELVSTLPYLTALVTPLTDGGKPASKKDMRVLTEAIKDLASRVVRMSGNLPQEVVFAIRNIESTSSFINFICANLNFSLKDKQHLLASELFEDRAQLLLKLLTVEVQMLEMKTSIQNKAMEKIDKQQREYFLQQQIKTIQSELGGTTQEQDLNQLREKAKTKKWNETTQKFVLKEIDKLEALSPHAPDYPPQMNYVQTLVDLPWNEYTSDNFNLKRAQRILDRDHYGLHDVKERIMEHLAVLKLVGDMKSPILCLYGPPGVGKTSLGKSVAEALGRKYTRISLGGLHDEAEIRGHRRTYIGALPGRIIQSLLKAGSANPVMILDEIDKVGNDFKGDPASALLEVLDPEQNNAFHDNFIDIDFDLSKVLFIATANDLSTVSRALLDRMELINISGYITEEKVEIASRHLVPKQWEHHGLNPKEAAISKKVLNTIVEHYTREAGVRNLDKQIAKLARRTAKQVALEQTPLPIVAENLKEYLGAQRFHRDKQSNREEVGIVTGLAWTSVGGEILEIETSLSPAKAGKLTLTGNLGDVMKESATLGLGYIKANATRLGVKEKQLRESDIHIHVPEGAVPKDGPSAGITMATSLLSALTGRKVRKHIAMTGEITLHGKVLPVGGIKEKILAAKRAGVTDIILCHENQHDIEDIDTAYLKGLNFHYVRQVEEVFQLALKE